MSQMNEPVLNTNSLDKVQVKGKQAPGETTKNILAASAAEDREHEHALRA